MDASIFVYGLSVLGHVRNDPSTLLLAGITVSSFLGALLTAALLSTIDVNVVQAGLGWLIDSMEGLGRNHFRAMALPIVVAKTLNLTFSRVLNLMLQSLRREHA